MDMLNIYLRTEFHTLITNGSIATTDRPIVKNNFRTIAMLFYISEKNYLFLEVYYNILFQDPQNVWRWFRSHFTNSSVRHVLLLTVGIYASPIRDGLLKELSLCQVSRRQGKQFIN
jgi:hypothetical protein